MLVDQWLCCAVLDSHRLWSTRNRIRLLLQSWVLSFSFLVIIHLYCTELVSLCRSYHSVKISICRLFVCSYM